MRPFQSQKQEKVKRPEYFQKLPLISLLQNTLPQKIISLQNNPVDASSVRIFFHLSITLSFSVSMWEK